MKVVFIEKLIQKISKMNCFSSLKKKSKEKKQSNSAPELRKQTTSDVSNNRVSKSANSTSSSRTIPELYRERQHNLRVFTYDELSEATNGFNRLLKVGEGGFGSVYKGTVKPVNGKGTPIVVAIKKLNRYGMQVYIDFN